MNEKKTEMIEKVNEQVVEKINSIVKDGIKQTNVDYLYKLVDIHKDLANEQYWEKEGKEEESDMRYSRGYDRTEYHDGGMYGRRRRDSRGRYMDSMERDEYGRRGKYRGHEIMDEMYDHYGNYQEGKEQHARGNYGAKEDTMKSLEYMLESVVDFIEMLHEDATSQEEINLIKKYTKKISEM